MKEARTKINDLQSQLDKTQTALAEAESRLNDPAFRERVAKLEEENRQLKASTEKVEASVSNIISTNAPLVEKAQTSVGGGANPTLGVIYSGDSTLAAAKYEVETIASKLGIPNARIYMDRNGSYRSVSVVDSSAQAEQVLAKAKQRRADAYIVRMSNWCPNATDKGAYRECGSP